MKKITLILILSMVTVFYADAHKYRNTHFTISMQTFYNELSPYGDWVYTPDYGYVWRPYFEHPDAFRPYSSSGNWVNTEYGWTWVSDYQWGWATFHYGRWDFDNYMGWVWIPGYELAPAWVTWGSYGDYWGWAPLGPNIYVQTSVDWYAPSPWWTFIPRRHFCSDNWNHYIYDRPVYVNNITYITNVYENNTTYNYGHHSNTSWYYGPRVNEVERYSNRSVRSMEIVESENVESTGVRNNRLNVYRPAIESQRKDARPVDYRNVEQVRRESTTMSTNARSNDPGENTTRGGRSVVRETERGSANNGSSADQRNRVDPRSATEPSGSSNSDLRNGSRVPPVTRVQNQSNPGTVAREKINETQTRSSNTENRSTPRPSTEISRGSQNSENNSRVTERHSGSQTKSRTEVTGNSFPHNNTPNREQTNRTSTQSSENRQVPVTRNVQNPSTHRASPESNTSSSPRENKNNGTPKTEVNSGSSSVEDPGRR